MKLTDRPSGRLGGRFVSSLCGSQATAAADFGRSKDSFRHSLYDRPMVNAGVSGLCGGMIPQANGEFQMTELRIERTGGGEGNEWGGEPF